MKEKLKGFPKIFALSLEEGIERKANFRKQAEELELDYSIIEVKRYPDCGTIVEGNTYDHLLHFAPDASKTTTAVAANHIRMIREWLKTSSPDEKYAMFCEDDISFETVEHWPFDWKEFTGIIPDDFKILQLCLIKGDLDYDLQLIHRTQWHWGANAYLVSRSYAERMIRRHCYSGNENLFNISTSVQEIGTYNPCLPEDVLFCDDKFDEDHMWVDSNGFYMIPLLIEDIKQNSFFDDAREDGHASAHHKCHLHTLKLWKEYNKEVKKWNK